MCSDYEIIKKCENGFVTVRFRDCEHENRFKVEHLPDIICNRCSSLNQWEYYYHFDFGMVHKSKLTRVCKICNVSDAMDRLVAIPKKVKNGMQFWYYHLDCMEQAGYTKESVEQLINNPSIKSKKITPHTKVEDVYQSNVNVHGKLLDLGMDMLICNRTDTNITNAFDLLGMCGIYSIVNVGNGKRYIGSSRNLYGRLSDHYNELHQDRHCNYKLQGDFKRGCEYKWELLEILDNDISNDYLYMCEQKYIDIGNTCVAGYNIHPVAGYSGSATQYYNAI